MQNKYDQTLFKFNSLPQKELCTTVQYPDYEQRDENKVLSGIKNKYDYSEKLGDEAMVLSERDYFFIENNEIIEKMIAGREDLKSKLISMVLKLKEMSETANRYINDKFSCWIWKELSLVHDFYFDGIWISFDLSISFTGWKLEMFGRDDSADKYIRILLKDRIEQIHQNNSRYILGCWSFSVSMEDINSTLTEWCCWLVEENEKTPSKVNWL